MTTHLNTRVALAEFLEFLAEECRKGTVRGMSIQTVDENATRVSVTFDTTKVMLPPGIPGDE